MKYHVYLGFSGFFYNLGYRLARAKLEKYFPDNGTLCHEDRSKKRFWCYHYVDILVTTTFDLGSDLKKRNSGKNFRRCCAVSDRTSFYQDLYCIPGTRQRVSVDSLFLVQDKESR